MIFKGSNFGKLVMAFFIGCCSCKATPRFATADNFSLLWEISGKGINKPSYLFGTVHLYDSTVFTIPKEVYKAIKNCDDFVSEIDFNTVDRLVMQQRMRIQDTELTLDKILLPDTYQKLLNIPVIQAIGEDFIKTIKPFFLTSYLVSDGAKSKLPSVDQVLEDFARKQKKNISGIETFDEQLDAVDALPLSLQAQMVEQWILEYDNPKETVTRMLTLYKNQDFKGFQEESSRSMPDPLFSEELIEKRNQRMAARINDSLQTRSNSYFIAVGALHLTNIDEIKGLVNLLQSNGYTLRPIRLKFE